MKITDRWRNRSVVGATLLAGALSLVWAPWLAHEAGDLAAQYAWTDVVRHHPRSAHTLSWYGGIHPASYSVVSPYLMVWIGVRTTGVLACTGCAALGALALTRFGIRRPLPPSVWLTVAVWSNLAAGRVTVGLAGDAIADFPQQHAYTTRRTVIPPDATRQALLTHTGDVNTLIRVGDNAERRMKYA